MPSRRSQPCWNNLATGRTPEGATPDEVMEMIWIPRTPLILPLLELGSTYLPGTVKGRPLSAAVSVSRKGTAISAHSSGDS